MFDIKHKHTQIYIDECHNMYITIHQKISQHGHLLSLGLAVGGWWLDVPSWFGHGGGPMVCIFMWSVSDFTRRSYAPYSSSPHGIWLPLLETLLDHRLSDVTSVIRNPPSHQTSISTRMGVNRSSCSPTISCGLCTFYEKLRMCASVTRPITTFWIRENHSWMPTVEIERGFLSVTFYIIKSK